MADSSCAALELRAALAPDVTCVTRPRLDARLFAPGVETQRQWSDAAVARTTPVVLGLFSVVTLLAARLVRDGRLPVRTAAWYAKSAPTFSDALAAVRAHRWRCQRFRTSPSEAHMTKLPRRVLQRLSEAACYAA